MAHAISSEVGEEVLLISMTMKRSVLKRYVREIASELERKPYDYWVGTKLPLTFGKMFKGQLINVEVSLLSSNAEYMQLGIAIDDGGWLSPYFPVGISIVIPQQHGEATKIVPTDVK